MCDTPTYSSIPLAFATPCMTVVPVPAERDPNETNHHATKQLAVVVHVFDLAHVGAVAGPTEYLPRKHTRSPRRNMA